MNPTLAAEGKSDMVSSTIKRPLGIGLFAAVVAVLGFIIFQFRQPHPSPASGLIYSPLDPHRPAGSVANAADKAHAKKLFTDVTTDQGMLASIGSIGVHNQIRDILAGVSPKFTLTDSQYEALVSIVIQMMKVNGILKAESAKVSVGNDGRIEITIPSRPDVALALWSTFQDHLAQKVSPAVADQIDNYIGEKIATLFWGYGLADETYRLDPIAGQPGFYSYDFAASIPEAIRTSDLNIVGRGFGRIGSSGSQTTIDSLGANPQYSFIPALAKTP